MGFKAAYIPWAFRYRSLFVPGPFRGAFQAYDGFKGLTQKLRPSSKWLMKVSEERRWNEHKLKRESVRIDWQEEKIVLLITSKCCLSQRLLRLGEGGGRGDLSQIYCCALRSVSLHLINRPNMHWLYNFSRLHFLCTLLLWLSLTDNVKV